MNNLVKSVIEKYSLFEKGDKVLVGLSGGADSMCLTHVLHCLANELGITVGAAHMNHNLRGDDAKKDAEAAEKFAESIGIEFHLGNVDVAEYARNRNISEELAGREVRYSFFKELQDKYGYTKIATAHNKNDNAETLLMNFMRGATMQGLCGIPIRRNDIIRPLLETSRDEIECYCKEHRLMYVTDKTNLETIYTRNKVRLNLIPQIESDFNVNFINTITKNAQLISDENAYIDAVASDIYKSYVFDGIISLDIIKSKHIALVRRVIIRMLADAIGTATDVSSTAVEDIIRLCETNESGKSINLPGEAVAMLEYGKLIISKKKDDIGEFEYKLEENERIKIPELGMYALLERCDSKINDGALYFSADDASDIRLRNRRFGDVFKPTGMNGSKKLKNLFIDDKIPRSKRMTIPIITVGTSIACVGKLRTDRGFSYGKNSICMKVNLIAIEQEEISIGT